MPGICCQSKSPGGCAVWCLYDVIPKGSGPDQRLWWAFLLYGEDVDLSYRVKSSSLENWYFAGTTIVHFKGESTQNYHLITPGILWGDGLFCKKTLPGKKAQVFLINTAIYSIKLLRPKRKIKRPPAAIPKDSQSLATAVVATQAVFDKVLQLLKLATYPILICGRIALSLNDNALCIGHASDMARVLKKYKIRQLVFCEGEQSFKEIIKQVETVPGYPGSVACEQ